MDAANRRTDRRVPAVLTGILEPGPERGVRRTMRRLLVLPLLALAGACASQDAPPPPADDGAGAAILAHLDAIAPMAIVPDSFAVIDVVRVADVVTFRTVWAFEDTSGVSVDTTAALAATVVDREDGSQVAGYDGAFASHIADLVDEDRRRRYEDLLDAVHHVYHAIVEQGWYYEPDGIDPAALRRLVEANGHTMANPWGITPIRRGTMQIIWLADANDDAQVCALPITEGEARPAGFEWVLDRQWFTCKGRTNSVYSRATIPEEIRTAMRTTRVLPPAPPAPSPHPSPHHDAH